MLALTQHLYTPPSRKRVAARNERKESYSSDNKEERQPVGDVPDEESSRRRYSVDTSNTLKVPKYYIFRTPGKAHLFWSFSLTIFTVVISIGLGFLWKLPEVDAIVPLQLTFSDTPKISMVINIFDIDLDGGTLTADWYPLAFDCDLPEVVAAIYFDPNLLATFPFSNVPSQAPPSTPTFIFNTTQRCIESNQNSFATFRTASKVIGSGGKSWGEGASLQNYPFDTYFSQISLFATSNSSGEPVGISVVESFGVPINVQVSLVDSMSINDENGLTIYLNIVRSSSLKALVVIVFVGNWLITILFLWVATAALIWPADTVRELFAIPIATLFAFTSVRANLPGAPSGFGTFLDYIGILPNIVLMTLTSALLLYVMLWRRVKDVLEGHVTSPGAE